MFNKDQEVKLKERLFIGLFTLMPGETGVVTKAYPHVGAYDVFIKRHNRDFFLTNGHLEPA